MENLKSTHSELANKIITSNTSSKWLINAIIGLEDRDVVDVIHELDLLKRIFCLKFKESITPKLKERE